MKQNKYVIFFDRGPGRAVYAWSKDEAIILAQATQIQCGLPYQKITAIHTEESFRPVHLKESFI